MTANGFINGDKAQTPPTAKFWFIINTYIATVCNSPFVTTDGNKNHTSADGRNQALIQELTLLLNMAPPSNNKTTSLMAAQFAKRPIAILIQSEKDYRDVQEKLFSLGLGFFDGGYPLSQRIESTPEVNAILVAPSGHLYIAPDIKDTGDAIAIYSKDFLVTDFSAEQARITDKLTLSKRRFEVKATLYALARVESKNLTLEQIDLIEECHKHVNIKTIGS